eukprot:5937070-Ditylum_brightwellii.AAC.1
MQLHVDSDAAYLVVNGAKSRIAGYFYCAPNSYTLNYNKTPHNAPILIECRTLKHAVCSAAEAECNTLFHNSQTAMGLRMLRRLKRRRRSHSDPVLNHKHKDGKLRC